MDSIAVVGAGPAGAWAAYCLASRGARVALFDPSHPREKPCGGGVTGRALALAAQAVDLSRLKACTIARARFTDSARGDAVTLTLPPADIAGHPPLVVISRADFDAALLAAACRAGATLHTERVTDVALEGNGVAIVTTRGHHRASFVIGADGANSLVRRRLSTPFRRGDLSIATGYYVHGRTSEEIQLEMVPDPPGYLWSFPRPDHLAVGICTQADTRATPEALRRRTARWIAETAIAPGANLVRYAWPIPSLGADRLAGLDLGGPRWCTVGDAAGLVDPITREGIYFAMLSGQWASDALGDGAPARYESRIREEVVPELSRAATFKASFFSPAFGSLMVDALRDSAAIRAVMVDLISGVQGYEGLKWRLARSLELGLAWRAISAMSARRRLQRTP